MKRIAILVAIILTLGSCYKDKGNYDYKDLDELVIEELGYQKVSLGQDVSITPVLNRDISKANYYTFKWSLDGQTEDDWNQLNFNWKANRILTNKSLILEITDTRYDVKYVAATGIDVIPIFDADMGWLILADDNNKSQLSLFKYVDFDYNDEEVIIPKEVKAYIDVTHSELNYDLGTGPIGMQLFYCTDRATKGELFIMQKSGAVDVGGISLEKEYNIADLFYGGVFPKADNVVSSCSFMSFFNVVADSDGKLYSRVKSTEKLFHSNEFIGEPITYKGNVLEQCELLRPRFSNEMGKHSLIIDNKNKCMFAINEGDTHFTGYEKDAGKIMDLDYSTSDAPAGWVPLDNFAGNTLVSKEWFWDGRNYISYAFLIKNDVTGKYTMQSFQVKRTGGIIANVISTTANKTVIPVEGIGEPSMMCVPTQNITSYAFFAVDNKIYLMDRANINDPIRLFITLPSKIVAMECEDKMNSQMGVGLENGLFYILDVRHAKNTIALPDDQKILYKSSDNEKVAKIVDIKRKIQTNYYY